jgi:diketogulonate reductase-like aldo/keto reductase
MTTLDRRRFVAAAGAAAATGANSNASPPLLMKSIPSTGETVPAVGMGSWLTFDVGDDPSLRSQRADVLSAFFEGGGRVIDSSPMYGSSQAVIGAALKSLGRTDACFAADKVWTPGGEDGPPQIERTRARWGVARFDLLQVHNLVDWRRHLDTLFAMRAEGRLRYVGVTTYAGLRHAEVEAIMTTAPIDFIQLTYNIADREAEERLLPLAIDGRIAVIANRPFREGALFAHVEGEKLPEVAADIGASTWAQFLLKFAISHPAITCAIPATRRVDHMRENIGALTGPMLDAATRRAMAAAFGAL